MTFYLDEQLPKAIAMALDTLEQHDGVHRVLSTEQEFGKGVKDVDLFDVLSRVDGVLITHDLKMVTRKNEFSIIKSLGVSVFIISLPSGANFETIYLTIIGMWPGIKKIARKQTRPFVCRLKMRGQPEFL